VRTALQKVTISTVMSVCPSACASIQLHGTTQLPHWIFMKIYDNVEKYGTARQATGNNIIQCMLDN